MRTSRPAASAAAVSCGAPFLALHLDPKGVVRACCENRMYELGRIPASSMREIWHGPRLEALREAMRVDDLSMGCDGCAHGVRSGDRASVRAGLYDADPIPSLRPERPVRLELELSNRCNLECLMCNGELSSTIRTKREGRPPLPRVYDDAFFAELADLAPHLDHVAFLGGEPFLGPEPLRAFEVLRTAGFSGRVHVTTNGTVVNDRVAAILDDLRVDVSISVDGATAATVEAIRVGVHHATLVDHIGWFREQARRRGTELRLHYCLVPQNWHELRPFLAWADELDVDVTVIPVRHPLAMNLDVLDPEDLRSVVHRMRAADEGATPLRRNAAAWRAQVDRLDRLGALPGVAASLEDLERWADARGTHTLLLDEGDVITEVSPDPADLLGIDARPLVGQHMQLLLGALEARFGALVGSSVAAASAGREDRTLVLGTGDRRTQVRAVRLPPTDGRPATWHLAARTVLAGADVAAP